MFDGRIKILFGSDTKRTVTVSGALPYDSAPGGWRASLAQLDTTLAPYGDIVALHPAHCFIPTVSALDLPTSNLFFDVAGTPDAVALTPFQAIYWAEANEEHVHISGQEAQWVIDELDKGSKLLDDHYSTHSKKKDGPETKEDSSLATSAKKGAVNAYFKGEEEDGTIKTFTPGSVSEGIVSCKLAGSLQFMKREQCAARGGRAK